MSLNLKEFNISEIDPTEKFECQRTYGSICCTVSKIEIQPYDVIKLVKHFGAEKILSYFPLLLPLIGRESLIPMIYKVPYTVCPFMVTEKPKRPSLHPITLSPLESLCSLNDKGLKPVSCTTYPYGRVAISQQDKEEVIYVKTENHSCPESAFEKGTPCKEMIESCPSETGRILKMINELREIMDKKTVQKLVEAPLYIKVFFGIEFVKEAEKIEAKDFNAEYLKNFYLSMIKRIEDDSFDTTDFIKIICNPNINFLEITHSSIPKSPLWEMMLEIYTPNAIEILKVNTEEKMNEEIENRLITLAKFLGQEKENSKNDIIT